MEESRKEPESENGGEVSGELYELLAISDDEFSLEIPINEEMVKEVMQELWREIAYRYNDDRDIITSLTPDIFPMASPLSSFIVVGGDNESCGPAFSDSASTVMAGTELSSGGVPVLGPTNFIATGDMGLPVPTRNGSWGGDEGAEKMDGWDGGEFDDEWVTRILNLGPQELEEWALL
ncbi:unnamed protein product [Ilex paraguariensis]|uniref:Uncharacterized protein n=1 Tax=Ilex paraguariensis TaxID=185542 RepID=A0ABC8RQ19_9AQUA